MNEEFKIGDIVTQIELFNQIYGGSKFVRKIIGFEKTPLGLTVILNKEIELSVFFPLTGQKTIKEKSIDPMWLKLDISAIRKEKLRKLNE